MAGIPGAAAETPWSERMQDPAAQPTVFLVDDDRGLRRSLSAALQQQGRRVVAYGSAEEFLEDYDLEPGCLLLDPCMPGMSGLDLQQAMAQKRYTLPIIFLAGRPNIPMSVLAIKGGALDVLEKPVNQAVLFARIEEAIVVDARKRLETARHEGIRRCFARLSPREKEVMALWVAGPANHSSKVIGARLGISHRTVDHHRTRIMDKMQAASVTELVAMARVCGLDVFTP